MSSSLLCDAPCATCAAQDMTSINEKHSRIVVCSECSGNGDLICEHLDEGFAAEPATTGLEEDGDKEDRDDLAST